MSRDKVSPGDPVYCAHGVCRDQPCGRCVQTALCTPKRSEAPSEAPESLSRRVGELEEWWLAMAREEIERTVPKAIEYGSGDLIDIGRAMARVMGREVENDVDAIELGIYFYEVGKMARWTDAVRHGRRVSDDTLFDLGVYIRMLQRARAAGGWPGINERTEG